MVISEKAGTPVVPEIIIKLLKSEILAVLGTTGNIGPHVCLILFAVDDNCTELYFATNLDTLKFKNIAAEPRVSVLLDNRSTRVAEGKGLSLTISGRASVLEGEQAQSAISKLLGKNSVHGATVDAQNCAAIRIMFETSHLVSTDGEQLFYRFV